LLLECARLLDEAGQTSQRAALSGLVDEKSKKDPRPTEDFDALFEDAIEASLSKNYVEALEIFRLAAALCPEDRKVNLNISRLEKILQLPGSS
jgi:hypothetical protein